MHMGEPFREAGDFFGKTVILAARIGSTAAATEILVSSTLKEVTKSAGDFHFDSGREVSLHGLSGTYHVFRALWSEGDMAAAEQFSTGQMKVRKTATVRRRSRGVALGVLGAVATAAAALFAVEYVRKAPSPPLETRGP